jgi:non-specific serine/threonine protein kinase
MLVPAVGLFVERARAVAPSFELTDENARAVAELCVRLDGLPLAIELVAPRAAQLGVAATLDRLGRRLPIRASPMRDAPPRQHSLEATLRWSVDLLDSAEQAVFRRVAVFAGGWSLEAAEAVAANAEVPDALSALLSLVDKNLIVAQAQLRFRMLETAREFAVNLLESSGEADDMGRRHAQYFTAFAERAEPELQGSSREVVERLEREDDNFRQALRWAFDSTDSNAQEFGLRLAGALGWYWFLHGAPAEAREWFQVLLRPATLEEQPSAVRTKALNAAGFRATNRAQYEMASEFHQEALRASRRLEDTPGLVASLHGCGDTALWLGNSALARAHYEEGLALAHAAGTAEDVALFAFHLAQLWWLESDFDTAYKYGEEALSVARGAGSNTWTVYALFVLASVAHERDQMVNAASMYREALTLAWQHHDRLSVRMWLPGLAGLIGMQGDAVRALRLAGAAIALEETADMYSFPPIRARQESWLAIARQTLDEHTAAAALADGRRMSLEDAIAYALEESAPPPDGPSASVPAARARLSGREREVLALVADGKSNREIARALIVTEHTAKYHVAQLLNKLGAGSRAEAVTRAVAEGLLAPTRD